MNTEMYLKNRSEDMHLLLNTCISKASFKLRTKEDHKCYQKCGSYLKKGKKQKAKGKENQ